MRCLWKITASQFDKRNKTQWKVKISVLFKINSLVKNKNIRIKIKILKKSHELAMEKVDVLPTNLKKVHILYDIGTIMRKNFKKSQMCINITTQNCCLCLFRLTRTILNKRRKYHTLFCNYNYVTLKKLTNKSNLRCIPYGEWYRT